MIFLLLACSPTGCGNPGPWSSTPLPSPEREEEIPVESEPQHSEPPNESPVHSETKVDSEVPIVDTGGAAECGDGVRPGSAPGLTRWPMLNSTTPTSTTIVWGGLEGTREGRAQLARRDEYSIDAAQVETWVVPIDPDETVFIRLYAATFTELSPDTEYCYRVAADDVVLASGLRFRTAPESTDSSVTFMIIGDYGTGSSDQFDVRDQMLQHARGVDLFLTVGDNAYGSGKWHEFHERVFLPYAELWQGMTIVPSPGNHDYGTAGAGPYFSSFVLPRQASLDEDQEAWFSMDWGPLHIVSLNTEDPARAMSADGTDDQDSWLEQDLAQADRPWTIALFHKPALSAHENRPPDQRARDFFVPLFDTYGLDVAFQGHNHFYERFEPMKEAGIPDDDGTVYVVTGGGGTGLYNYIEDAPGRAAQAKEHHFLLGEASKCRFYIQAIAKDGTVLDSWTLVKCDEAEE